MRRIGNTLNSRPRKTVAFLLATAALVAGCRIPPPPGLAPNPDHQGPMGCCGLTAREMAKLTLQERLGVDYTGRPSNPMAAVFNDCLQDTKWDPDRNEKKHGKKAALTERDGMVVITPFDKKDILYLQHVNDEQPLTPIGPDSEKILADRQCDINRYDGGAPAQVAVPSSSPSTTAHAFGSSPERINAI